MRCFQAVLAQPPQDPPIDVDALCELSAALLELARLTSVLATPSAHDVAARMARVEGLVAEAAERCGAVEVLEPTRLEDIMELRMDIARLTSGCCSATPTSAAAVEVAWSNAAIACQRTAAEAQLQGQQGRELAACAVYNAACVAALRSPVDEATAAACLSSAVDMALAARSVPEAHRSETYESAFVSVADLQEDRDLEAVRGCAWFEELIAQLQVGGASGSVVDSSVAQAMESEPTSWLE